MSNVSTQIEDRAKEQARLQLEAIAEMVKRLNHANADAHFCTESAEYHDVEKAREAIEEDPLTVEVRSAWHRPGADEQPAEYTILLCWGGPAVRMASR